VGNCRSVASRPRRRSTRSRIISVSKGFAVQALIGRAPGSPGQGRANPPRGAPLPASGAPPRGPGGRAPSPGGSTPAGPPQLPRHPCPLRFEVREPGRQRLDLRVLRPLPCLEFLRARGRLLLEGLLPLRDLGLPLLEGLRETLQDRLVGSRGRGPLAVAQ